MDTPCQSEQAAAAQDLQAAATTNLISSSSLIYCILYGIAYIHSMDVQYTMPERGMFAKNFRFRTRQASVIFVDQKTTAKIDRMDHKTSYVVCTESSFISGNDD